MHTRDVFHVLNRMYSITRPHWDRGMALKDIKDILSKLRQSYKPIANDVIFNESLLSFFKEKDTQKILMMAMRGDKTFLSIEQNQQILARIKNKIKEGGILAQWFCFIFFFIFFFHFLAHVTFFIHFFFNSLGCFIFLF